MGKIILNESGEEARVSDGESILDACESLGVPFGCQDGNCGVCQIEIKKGLENLSEMNSKEKVFSDDENIRLACQCKLKKGEVKIDF